VRKSAEKVIDKIIRDTPNASVEDLIKQALKNL
jgi:Holliday junction DNA helicase RuvA